MLALLAIAAVFVGMILYAWYALVPVALHVDLWAGSLAALGQMLAAGLVTWGLRLARQRQELEALPELATPRVGAAGFRMSYGDDAPAASVAQPHEVKTLEIGFQRVLVALTGFTLVGLALCIGWMVTRPFAAAEATRKFPVAPVDPLLLVFVVGAVAVYVALWSVSRRGSRQVREGQAITGLLSLGLPGFIMLGVAALAGYAGVPYVSEIAAGVVALLLVVQGFELLVNSIRSYAGIEEFDQQAVDLHATPLAPMLTSLWIDGLRMLAGESLGMSRQRGVVARLMPRTLVALVILAILASMIRVVNPGEVAILERLGHVRGCPDPAEITKTALHPGIHLTLPWPIDRLTYIPHGRVRFVSVGNDVEIEPGVDFHFWASGKKDEDIFSRFVTGDHDNAGKPAQQLLETYAVVTWSVRNPGQFYMTLSHSEFASRGSVRPIYEAMVEELAARAITRAFAECNASDIMAYGRKALEERCLAMLQKELDALRSGIEIRQLNIKDVHPPVGNPVQFGPEGQSVAGPAEAYEAVVQKLEEKETKIIAARTGAYAMKQQALGQAVQEVQGAEAQAWAKRGDAEDKAQRLGKTIRAFAEFPDAARRRVYYDLLNEILPAVPKVIVGPDVGPVDLWPAGRDGNLTGPRPGL